MANDVALLFNLCKGVLTRLIFLVHAIVALTLLYMTYRDDGCHFGSNHLILIPLVCMALEGIYSIAIKNGMELDYFWPSGFLFIASVLPVICIIEMKPFRAKCDNATITTTNTTAAVTEIFNFLRSFGDAGVLVRQWSQVGIIIFLLIGRWLMPLSGSLTRAQLSALLLSYVGCGADIMELFESLQSISADPNASLRDRKRVTIGVLFIYTLALLQFTLISTANIVPITSTKNNKEDMEDGGMEHPRCRKNHGSNVAIHSEETCKKKRERCGCCRCKCVWHEEFFQIFVTLFMQDGPFFILRLVCCIEFQVINELYIFFLMKNAIVIILLVYRLMILSCHCDHSAREKQKRLAIMIFQAHNRKPAAKVGDGARGQTGSGQDNPALDLKEEDETISNDDEDRHDAPVLDIREDEQVIIVVGNEVADNDNVVDEGGEVAVLGNEVAAKDVGDDDQLAGDGNKIAAGGNT